jgi:transcriptional regulator CtsR
MKSPENGQILLYQGLDGKIEIEVSLRDESVWLNLNQLAELFDRDKSVISRHLRNIFRSEELSREAVVAKNATTAADGKTYYVEYYNLDAIISVGYRVNSKRGTQFRIWATNVLRQHLVEGYTLHQKRLQAQSDKIRELQQAIRMIDQIADHKALASDEASALIRVIRDYAYGLDLIDAYDHQRVDVSEVSKQAGIPLDYQAARQAIDELRKLYQAGDLFGREKDDSFQGSLANVFQTYDKRQLYPSIEEKASNLLYFLVRNKRNV